MSDIAIVGTGSMATNLAIGWTRAGHSVVLGSRDPATKHASGGAAVVDHEAALDAAPIVVIAIPFTVVEPFAREHADVLRKRLVIDISNPFAALPDNSKAAAEFTRDAIGDGARVVAAFKDNFAANLLEGRRNGEALDVRIAGDDPSDKAVVAELAKDLGFRALDCGPLERARVLDGMVSLMLELDERYGGRRQQSGWAFFF